jgi:hypothetical protein
VRHLCFDVEYSLDTTTPTVAGELDLTSDGEFGRVRGRHLRDGSANHVLDLCGIRFPSVAGHGRLQSAITQAARRGRAVRVTTGAPVRNVSATAFASGAFDAGTVIPDRSGTSAALAATSTVNCPVAS